MAQAFFTAAKTQSDRPGWTITFRHPLRPDTHGRPGRKVRRGLGTSDPAVADELVAQMNILLSDQSWWSASRRQEASARFAKPIVAAFFDDLQAGADDPEALRDAHLRLPGHEEGYTRVLFVGTTGAGKTTLLRQLIGSDPELDRFPSTAPAKTTIADIEVIAVDGPFSAIVTFFTEFQVQAYLEECVLAAALAVHNNESQARVAGRFLNHSDQKFRLSYILGPWGNVEAADDLSFDDEDDDAEELIGDDDLLPANELEANRDALVEMVARISHLAGLVSRTLSNDLGLDLSRTPKEDHDAFLELLEEAFEAELQKHEAFHDLVQDILDKIRTRFSRLDAGTLNFGPSGWPASWTLETDDRDEFIGQIRWFSSNYWPHFGRLLTPIVNGIRVSGPLYPATGAKHRLVLIDGQGLGHTPDMTASVTTHITRRFDDVDVILLVDNAQQPMLAAPMSLLRAAALSGNEEKVAIAFTHFDQIKGSSLPTAAEKRAHVMASVMNALSSLKDSVGVRVTRNLERGIDGRCFMLGGTQRKLSSLNSKAKAFMEKQLELMLGYFDNAAIREEEPTAEVVYDPIGLPFAIQEGVSQFIRPWKSRLGLSSYGAYRKEHWTRIKALTRRMAGGLAIEYDTLKPVADLQAGLSWAISRYLDRPVEEVEAEGDERATARVRRLVATPLLKLCEQRLVEDALPLWRDADDQTGKGSGYRRAVVVATLMDKAAPLPDVVMTQDARLFLDEVANIVIDAVAAVGGRVSTSFERS